MLERPTRRRPKNRIVAPLKRKTIMPPLIGGGSAPPENAHLIYVYGDIDGDGAGKVAKFGKTRNRAEVRLRQHEQRGPLNIEMTFLAAVWGHPSDELTLIDYFKSRGINLPNRNEWMDASNEQFRSWVRYIRTQSYTAITPDEVETIPYVDSRYWLPNGKNMQFGVQTRLPFDNDPWADLSVDDEMDGDYYTHPILIEAIRMTFGAIDLDPASCRAANKVVRATRIFGALQDGLQFEWEGRVWLNPPFGCWRPWSQKAIREVKSGRVKEIGIYMTANASTANQVHELIEISDAVFMPRGRYDCWGPKATVAAEGAFIFYIGKHADRFRESFKAYGTVFFTSIK